MNYRIQYNPNQNNWLVLRWVDIGEGDQCWLGDIKHQYDDIYEAYKALKEMMDEEND